MDLIQLNQFEMHQHRRKINEMERKDVIEDTFGSLSSIIKIKTLYSK